MNKILIKYILSLFFLRQAFALQYVFCAVAPAPLAVRSGQVRLVATATHSSSACAASAPCGGAAAPSFQSSSVGIPSPPFALLPQKSCRHAGSGTGGLHHGLAHVAHADLGEWQLTAPAPRRTLRAPLGPTAATFSILWTYLVSLLKGKNNRMLIFMPRVPTILP